MKNDTVIENNKKKLDEKPLAYIKKSEFKNVIVSQHEKVLEINNSIVN